VANYEDPPGAEEHYFLLKQIINYRNPLFNILPFITSFFK